MKRIRNDRGATLVEYALIVAFCALVLIGAILALGAATKGAILSHCEGHAAPNGVCTLK